MATDMCALARVVAKETRYAGLGQSLRAAADSAEGSGILARLRILGRAVSAAVRQFDGPMFNTIARHRSDVVRQWAAYAVNDPHQSMTLQERLTLTLPFAADHHMSVRECAWMAFRPYLIRSLETGLRLLEPATRSLNPNVRRFAIEVTRPRSVWGAHIGDLKRKPEKAIALLKNVREDESRYVRLAAGNWLNDASKTRPDWVIEVCQNWSLSQNKRTRAIVRRGLRTLTRGRAALQETATEPGLIRVYNLKPVGPGGATC